MTRFGPLALGCALITAPLVAQDGRDVVAENPWGHSAHGSSYDVGPRQKPWLIEGIGEVSFPITTSHPEVQAWFEHGVALLHSFWWYEAERSFRWCVKLDPDCAMAYWGLAHATNPHDMIVDRSSDFLAEAIARRDAVTARERGYIDVTEALFALKALDDDDDERESAVETLMERVDRLLMDYPADAEAKVLYPLVALEVFGIESPTSRYAVESVLSDILARNPDHVGAMHYRIHNWDGEQGSYVVDTCMRISALAPGSGHLQHMPGHVLSSIGLWHEAAIAMDNATRVEKAYMHERLIMPENNWDYGHNLDYLGYIQEQLGMVEAALDTAAQRMKAPLVSVGPMAPPGGAMQRRRALMKFERWGEALDDLDANEGAGPPNPLLGMFDLHARARAVVGLGRLGEAEAALAAFKGAVTSMFEGGGGGGPPGARPGGPLGPTPGGGAGDTAGPPRMPPPEIMAFIRGQLEAAVAEVEALVMIEQGELLEGLALLADAADKQLATWEDDPPVAATVHTTTLGDAYLKLGAHALAIECYERTLDVVRNDGFALAGLVVAHHRAGNVEQAEAAMATLGVVWSDADPNRRLDAVVATGVRATPAIHAPIEQRNYKRALERLGPSLWVPAPVPSLAAINAAGETVTLADHHGHNVLLVFYLGDECVHCMEQIQLIEERLDELRDLNTVVLAVSKDSVDEIAEQSESLGITLLSDPNFENARRFASYDDFEDIELHSTFLIDRDGRLRWSRIGGEPFTGIDGVERELKRMNAEHAVLAERVPARVGGVRRDAVEASPAQVK